MSIAYAPNSQSPTPGPGQNIPQDGDPLVVSSVNVALTGLMDNAAFLLLKSGGANNPKNFGALGDASHDDTAAINAALAVPGVTILTPGFYRITNTILIPDGSSLMGFSGSTVVLMDHATNDVFRFSANISGHVPSKVSDVAVGALHAASGAIFTDGGNDCDAIIENVQVNTTGAVTITGGLWAGSGSGSRVRITGCTGNIRGANPYIGSASGQQVDVESCLFTYSSSSPGTIGVDYEAGAHGHVIGCTFDFRAVTSGHPVGVLMNSGTVVTGCRFLGSTLDPNASLQACMTWATPGVKVCIGSNSFVGCPLPFDGGTVPPTVGDESSVELVARFSFGTSSVPVAINSFSVPDGYACCECWLSNTTPTISLPQIIFPGQILTLVVKNKSSADWASGPTINIGGGMQVFLDPMGHLPGSLSDLQVTRWLAIDVPTTGSWRWFLLSESTGPSSF